MAIRRNSEVQRGKHAAEVDRKLQYFRDNFDRMRATATCRLLRLRELEAVEIKRVHATVSVLVAIAVADVYAVKDAAPSAEDIHVPGFRLEEESVLAKIGRT